MLRFEAGETQKEIVVPIVDDDMSEPDVTFSVVLTDLKGADAHLVQVRCCLPCFGHLQAGGAAPAASAGPHGANQHTRGCPWLAPSACGHW